ncbi:DUF4097 family beta strand repeat-containing protein [Streptomyces adelaidensis]|uniref:DUF4097 family beta strand repeat-containing protein n=1 Tax=Streptomyces adelaidensis TaxID=2796465 RepID=UPI001908AE1A|nr:DUF4097 family beta strand repeat-containing protein [Streptomyces adelaidensis]
MSEWSVAEPRKLTFDEPVTALRVRVVHGTVNVVGTDEGSARLEVSALEGPPLTVTQKDGTLTVAYDDLPWKGFLKWLDRKGWRRSALVSLAVPSGTRVEVGVVGATAVVTGLAGRTEVKGLSGDTTLVGLTGPVRATTVSGNVEAQALTGSLRLSSVSGDLTVIEGACPTVKAESVSGSIVLDLDSTGGPADIGLTSVSGGIAIRLPHPTDAEVEANTAAGTISNAFDDLRVSGLWGAHKVTGRLGTGNGRLKAMTVSGSIALLRRPPAEDEPWGEDPGTGAGAGRGLGDGATTPAAERPAPVTDNSTVDSPIPPAAPAAVPPTDLDGSAGDSAATGSAEPSADGSADGAPVEATSRTTDKKVL